MPNPGLPFLLPGDGQAGAHASYSAELPAEVHAAGRAHFLRGELLTARDLFTQAVQCGHVPAAVDLARTLRFTGETGTARALLTPLLAQDHGAEDRGLLTLELGALDLAEGQLRRAHDHFTAAGVLLSPLAASRPERCRAARLLASTYARLGLSTPAQHYLSSALTHAQGPERLLALHAQARIALDAAQFDLAAQALEQARPYLDGAPVAAGGHHLLLGQLACARGRWETAMAAFEEARRLAQRSGELGTECQAALGRAALLTAQQAWGAAHAELLRAQRLSPTPSLRALVDLRLGAWHAARGDTEALACLDSARAAFAALHLTRETAWCDLHRSAALLPDLPSARRALEGALQARHAHGSPVLLAELRLLPHLLPLLQSRRPSLAAQALQADWRAAFPDEPFLIELRTLGQTAVLVDGHEIRLGMRRTVELLAFLLLRGPATRSQLLSALWGDDDPRRAANYFHQAKRELSRHLPWLRILLDKASGEYRVSCEGALFQWDLPFTQRELSADSDDEVAETIRSLPGLFLPDVDTQWVREERDALEWTVMKSGLSLMKRWSERGEYQKCADLAARLLDIDPCDEALVEYLVTATLELEGRVAAQRALSGAAQRAQQELGLRPDWEQRLMGTLAPLPN